VGRNLIDVDQIEKASSDANDSLPDTKLRDEMDCWVDRGFKEEGLKSILQEDIQGALYLGLLLD